MGKMILFQGDSVTDCRRDRQAEGVPNDCWGMGNGYAMLVAARLLADHPECGYRFLNRGISGNRVIDLYARWKIDALNLQPDVLSILVGINDTWHEKEFCNGVGLERFEKIYRELLSWTQQRLPQCQLILCEPFVLNFGAAKPDWIGEMAVRSKITCQLAKEFEVPFVPFQKVIDSVAQKAAPDYVLRDGVHPLLPGHQAMADEWIKVAREHHIIA